MSARKVSGLVIAVVGVGSLLFSMYIKNEVAKGRGQIKDAQGKVDTGKGLFSLSPYTKDVGDALGSSAQKKIDEGKMQADAYEALAQWLQIGGIALIVIGAAVFLVPKKK